MIGNRGSFVLPGNRSILICAPEGVEIPERFQRMIYPLSHAVITQYFGEHPDDYLQYGFPGHNGIDLVTVDSPAVVYAFSGGRCVKVGWQEEGYGKYIVIELGENQFYYCHLAGVFIKPGDQVIER